MNCRDFRKHLIDLLDARPDRAAQEEPDKHLEACAQCRQEYEKARKTLEALMPSEKVRASAGFKDRVMDEIQKLEDGAAGGRARGRLGWRWNKPLWSMAAAAVILLAVSYLGWLVAAGKEEREASSLLARAYAAEKAIFEVEGIAHLINEIVVYPVSDSNLAKMRFIPLGLIKATGKPGSGMLIPNAGPGEGCTVMDESWVDPDSGRFARVLRVGDQPIFANAYDGRFVYSFEPDTAGVLHLVTDSVAGDFVPPESMGQILGLGAGFKSQMEQMDQVDKNILKLKKAGRERLADGSMVRLIKAIPQMPTPGRGPGGKKMEAYALLKIRESDDILVEWGTVIMGERMYTYRNLMKETVKGPGIPWDLAGLEQVPDSTGVRPKIRIHPDMVSQDIPESEILKKADFAACLFASNPTWTSKRLINVLDMPVLDSRMAEMAGPVFIIVYQADSGRHLVLIQGKMYDKIGSSMPGQAQTLYESPGGFRVLGWPKGSPRDMEKMMAQTMLMSSLSSMGVKYELSRDRRCYILESPEGTFLWLAVNGSLSEGELAALADDLVSVEESLGRSLLEKPGKPGGEEAWSTLFAAAGTGSLDTVNALLEAGVDPNAKNERTGVSVLMFAASRGRTEIVKSLLAAGADTQAGDRMGRTALMYAAGSGHLGAVQALLEAGAEASARDSTGRSAFSAAAEKGRIEIVKYLLGAGADPNEARDDGRTALMIAAGKGHAEAVNALLGAGAEVNARAVDSTTALMWSAYGGNPEVVEALLNAGGEVNASSHNGSTALMDAADNGEIEMVRLLLEAGADVNAKNHKGETAARFASQKKHTEIARLLGRKSLSGK